MEQELTIDEFKRVAALYYGQRVLKFSKDAPATQNINDYMLGRMHEKCVLYLIPLSSITEEDIEQVLKMEINYGLKCVEDIWQQVYYLKYPTFMYLISKGYDMPLYFSPNHWANSKTAVELGIAIENK